MKVKKTTYIPVLNMVQHMLNNLNIDVKDFDLDCTNEDAFFGESEYNVNSIEFEVKTTQITNKFIRQFSYLQNKIRKFNKRHNTNFSVECYYIN